MKNKELDVFLHKYNKLTGAEQLILDEIAEMPMVPEIGEDELLVGFELIKEEAIWYKSSLFAGKELSKEKKIIGELLSKIVNVNARGI